MTMTRHLLLLSVVGTLAACGAGDQAPPPTVDPVAEPDAASSLVVRGQMYYLERIALTPGSVAVVELRADPGPYAPLLAQSREALGDRQVPIDFELQVDAALLQEAGQPVFRAGIVSAPGPLRVTEVASIDQAYGVLDLGQLRLRPAATTAFGVPYRCGDQVVVFGALGEHLHLVVDELVIPMLPEVSASGARFAAVDGSQSEFWSKGDQAMVTLRGEVLDNCEGLTELELPFTARGQEPGWTLRIDEEALVITVRYGEQALTFPRVHPEISAAGIRYEADKDEHRLTVLVDRQPCNDTMADLVYPFRVRYTLDGDAQMGCGGDPRDMLTGGEWLIETIGGESPVEGTVPTIEFLHIEGEDRFAGRASCNRYMGTFRLSGEGLNLSPAASTLMACADEEQALQEQRLISLLGEVYGFGIDDEGRLLLRAGSQTIRARR